MKTIFPVLIFTFLFSCSENTTENKIKDTTITSAKVKDTVRKQTPATPDNGLTSIQNLTQKLKPISFPCKLESDRNIDSNWVKLSNDEIKMFIPDESLENNKVPQIFAINKFSNLPGTGILYSIVYPESAPDDMDPDDVRSETLLVLYSNDGQYQDHKTIAIDDYGNGSSKIKSLNEIIYLYSSEMEFINISKTVYSIDDLKFKEIKSEDKTFTSSNEDVEKMSAYLENAFK